MMTDDKIEQVARAIYEAANRHRCDVDDPGHTFEEWEDFRVGPRSCLSYVAARAAIEAMSEPTEAMCDAAYGMCGETSGSSQQARAVFRVMMAVALFDPVSKDCTVGLTGTTGTGAAYGS